MDRIEARLNAVLAPDERVRFGPSISNQEFLVQRFTEALYPRLVDDRSQYRLEVVPAAAYSGPPERALGVFRAGPSTSMVVLFGPPSAPPAPAPLPSVRLDLSWLQLAGACISTLGIGLVLLVALRRLMGGRPPGSLALAVAILLCGLLFGLLVSVATWLQVPLPWAPAAAIGPLLLVAAVIYSERRGRRVSGAIRRAGGLLRQPENFVFAAFLVLFGLGMARVPIIGWDGRSIWMFRARQIAFRGMLVRSEALRPSLQFSHPEYPVFFPAWAAFFGSYAGSFNEHLAAMSIPVLFAACGAALWIVARRSLGRWLGASFAGIAFFALEGSLAAGFVDGFVCVLLLVEFLCLSKEDVSGIGWVAAAAASLIKQEGFYFAIAIGVFCTAAFPHLRSKSLRARAAPFLVFVPGIVQFAWSRALGIRGDFFGIQWASDFADLGSRAGTIAAVAGNVLRNGPLNTAARGLLPLEGTAAWLIVLALLVARRRASSAAGAGSFLVGTFFGAFILAVLFITPQDLYWHAGTSLGRLLVTPMLFFVLALFFFLRDFAGVVEPDV